MASILKFSMRGAIGFGIGGLIYCLMEWIFIGSKASGTIEPLMFTIIPVTGYFVSGLVGSIILLRGIEGIGRGAGGFGCGFAVTSFGVLFTMLSLQGSGSPEYSWAAIGCGTSFAVGGGIGALILRPALMPAGCLAFGIAGAVWGPVLFWQAWYVDPIIITRESLIQGACILIMPFVLGGALFGIVIGAISGGGEK